MPKRYKGSHRAAPGWTILHNLIGGMAFTAIVVLLFALAIFDPVRPEKPKSKNERIELLEEKVERLEQDLKK